MTRDVYIFEELENLIIKNIKSNIKKNIEYIQLVGCDLEENIVYMLLQFKKSLELDYVSEFISDHIDTVFENLKTIKFVQNKFKNIKIINWCYKNKNILAEIQFDD
jgi:hypothetical protein